jgi:hypothetical protein
MDMPLSECLSYCEKANTVDPEDAICYLADMYIENCGVSLSMRGFADYCSNYWIKKLEMESNTEMSEKYHGALTLGQILPYVSEKYHDGLLDEYDSCVMSHKELRNILFEQIKNLIDEKVKIILCAGIFDSLLDPEYGWLYDYPIEKIEEGIINFKDVELISHRVKRDRKRLLPHLRGRRNQKLTKQYKFSDEEIAHFMILNERLVELQHEIMEQVKFITKNLQEQIEKGFNQYDTYCIDGYIYIEPFEEDHENKLLEVLSEHAKYTVIFTNDNTTQDKINDEIIKERHWYANWGGIFHQLEESHGLKLCKAFCYLFDESEIFTIADIMKIRPEMFMPHVEINI